MRKNHYPLLDPVDAIIFDCDGTLSFIEGIDELAKENGVGEPVMKITAEAMTHSGINPELYQRRLNLVLPTQQQVQTLGQAYFDRITPDHPLNFDGPLRLARRSPADNLHKRPLAVWEHGNRRARPALSA